MMLDAAVDPKRQLRDSFSAFASGVTVVTLRDDAGQPTGITVNSFASLSLNPPLILFAVGCHQVSCRWLEREGHFAVNVLAADQEALAWRFARPSKDKFENVDWTRGVEDTPLIDGTIARMVCRKWNVVDGGDHKVVIGEVVDHAVSEGDPLLFFRSKMRQIGS